jgi:hypothetical protein
MLGGNYLLVGVRQNRVAGFSCGHVRQHATHLCGV